MKDLSRSQPVTYTVNVVISRKRCQIESLLLQTTNRKLYNFMGYWLQATWMTLSHLQGHFHCKPFECDYSYTCAAVDKISTDIARRAVSPSAVAELLLWNTNFLPEVSSCHVCTFSYIRPYFVVSATDDLHRCIDNRRVVMVLTAKSCLSHVDCIAYISDTEERLLEIVTGQGRVLSCWTTWHVQATRHR